MRGNIEMKLPGLENFKSIHVNITDLKDKVNQLQSEKRIIRLSLNSKQAEINKLILEIEKMEKNQK